MKNKILCALLALIMIIGLLPMTALAEDPAATVKFNNNIASDFSLTVKPGETAFVTTDATAQFVQWQGTDEPADNFIKFDYPADSSATLKVTFKNIEADVTTKNIWHDYGICFESGEYAVALELIGTNKISHGSSACIKYYNAGGMTITGDGSLSLTNTGSVHGSIWADGGDLVIKNTKVNIVVAQGTSSMYHAILATKGNVTLDGAKIESTTDGGYLVFFGKPKGDDKDGRYSLDPDTNRKLVIKNSDITFTCNQSKTAFKTAAPAVISNSTLVLTSKLSEGPLISPAPTFEGEYTAIAGLAKDAVKNPHKLKEFNPKKLASYTYIKIVPGIVEGLIPTTEAPTTEATEAPTTEAPTTEAPTTEAPTTEATQAPTTADKNDSTKPTTADKNEATKPTTADKDNDKTDKGEEKSGSPLKVVLIILIVLVVAAGAAVGVIFYLRNKNAALEEGEEEAEEAEDENEE